ncbi:MAG: acyl-[Paludibacteraceae bacterium]|nr:acyl-[acyl-carrier-protein] thioesterase [Paludibacteraceae bacterium]
MKLASYSYKVALQDVDFTKKLKITRLIGYLLETAGRNAFENNFGIQHLQAENYTWVLSRLAVEMETYPLQDEEFIIETWIENAGRLFTTRNFCIKNLSGKLIGSSTSIWAMIDINTRRAVDLTDEYASFVVDKPSPCEHPRKMPPILCEPHCEYKVKYSDIDLNCHANSAKYIEWLLDTIENPKTFFENKHVARIELYYMNEALLGDVLSFYKENREEQVFLFEIKRNTDSICKMRLVF